MLIYEFGYKAFNESKVAKFETNVPNSDIP